MGECLTRESLYGRMPYTRTSLRMNVLHANIFTGERFTDVNISFSVINIYKEK